MPDPTATAPSDWDEDEDRDCFHHLLHSSQQYATALVLNIGVSGFLIVQVVFFFFVRSSLFFGCLTPLGLPLLIRVNPRVRVRVKVTPT